VGFALSLSDMLLDTPPFRATQQSRRSDAGVPLAPLVLALLPRLEPGVLRRLRCDEIGAIQRRQLAASKVVWTPALEAEAVRQGMSGPGAADAPRREVAADTPAVWVIDGGILPDDEDDEPDEPTTLHEGGRS